MSSNPFSGDQNVPATSGNGAGIDLSQFDDDFESAELSVSELVWFSFDLFCCPCAC